MPRTSATTSGRKRGSAHETLTLVTGRLQDIATRLEGRLMGERLSRMLDEAGYGIVRRVGGRHPSHALPTFPKAGP